MVRFNALDLHNPLEFGSGRVLNCTDVDGIGFLLKVMCEHRARVARPSRQSVRFVDVRSVGPVLLVEVHGRIRWLVWLAGGRDLRDPRGPLGEDCNTTRGGSCGSVE